MAAIDLGLCCVCEMEWAAGVVMIDRRVPWAEGDQNYAGTWGCLKCHLPHQGAIAVLCVTCGPDESVPVKYIVKGEPRDNERVLLEDCPEEFRHDAIAHADEFPAFSASGAIH